MTTPEQEAFREWYAKWYISRDLGLPEPAPGQAYCAQSSWHAALEWDRKRAEQQLDGNGLILGEVAPLEEDDA